MAGWQAIASLPTVSINRAHWCAIPILLSADALNAERVTDVD
jgi:hypothetical protein